MNAQRVGSLRRRSANMPCITQTPAVAPQPGARPPTADTGAGCDLHPPPRSRRSADRHGDSLHRPSVGGWSPNTASTHVGADIRTETASVRPSAVNRGPSHHGIANCHIHAKRITAEQGAGKNMPAANAGSEPAEQAALHAAAKISRLVDFAKQCLTIAADCRASLETNYGTFPY